MWLLLLCTLAYLGALLVESAQARRIRMTIPVRIHVNGTRGKSSVAAYVAAAFRAHGRRTLCKVTGVVPTLILPDGSRRRLSRIGTPRLQEQLSFLRHARHYGCEVVVCECMSITPLLQRAERLLIRPTIAVLTNILDDHREDQGITERERVAGFLQWLPEKCTLITGERRHAGTLEEALRRIGSSLVHADSPGSPHRGNEGMLPENVSLALAVCQEAGLDADVARHAIAEEDGRIRREDLPVWFERDGFRFLNAFAVNDLASLERFLEHWESRTGPWSKRMFLLNTRSDRPLRSLEFARWIGAHPEGVCTVVTGTHRQATRRALLHAGVPREQITLWSSSRARRAGQGLLSAGCPAGTVVIGMGNIAGDGFRILEGIRSWSSNLC
jgi:poly-gamma-glutamate synthase PgsB/CapB